MRVKRNDPKETLGASHHVCLHYSTQSDKYFFVCDKISAVDMECHPQHSKDPLYIISPLFPVTSRPDLLTAGYIKSEGESTEIIETACSFQKE
ncbi:hypothetical protein TNIN_287011 [Trichonephila inaurata madagascariensis]|uniref:Uncharacterized protein n=1 Tax=Trichonephila inaurata madagascariensis TaxID=2747483 RepID=A0A8X6XXI9_9ARAC|nr:hypothetical protein TNIN_287011 [Trichonephila inaurata madagascariensis]